MVLLVKIEKPKWDRWDSGIYIYGCTGIKWISREMAGTLWRGSGKRNCFFSGNFGLPGSEVKNRRSRIWLLMSFLHLSATYNGFTCGFSALIFISKCSRVFTTKVNTIGNHNSLSITGLKLSRSMCLGV